MQGWKYKKGRTLMSTLILSGLTLTGWTVFLLVMGNDLPLTS